MSDVPNRPISPHDKHEHVGCIEIRWADGDPDDVVAPWPKSLVNTPVSVHVERMDEGTVWMEITDEQRGLGAIFWLRAVRKGVLEWTSTERREYQ